VYEGWDFCMININEIRQLCENESLRWTNHALIRLLQRRITTNDVICALLSGEIIEQYPADYPYPSCLILGLTKSMEHLHVVCGVSAGEVWLITAYYPNSNEWMQDFKSRKESK